MIRKSLVIVLLAMALTVGVVGSSFAMMMGTPTLISPATGDLVWDDMNKLMGVGTNTPMYNLDITALGAMRSSMHFSLNGNDVGGWMTSVGDTNFFMSSGAMYDLSQGGWIQKSSSGVAAVVGGDTPGISMYTASGTAVGGHVAFVPRMRITPAGNVGIGTTAPTQALEVNGGMRMNTTATQPLCDASTRGTLWFAQGPSKDTIEACVMNGSYMWIQLF